MTLTDTEAIILQIAVAVMVLLAYALGVATSIYTLTRRPPFNSEGDEL